MGLSHDGALMSVPGDRHGYRHGEKGLDKRIRRYYDGDDAHDGLLRRFSR